MTTAQKLKKLEAGSKIAIKRTISDLKARSNPQIKAAIKTRYGVNDSAINKAKKRAQKNGTIKVSGMLIDGISLPYQGRPLTITHFSMNPKRPKKKPYQITATIKDGKNVTFSRAFLAAPNGSFLPFQRKGERRFPIETIHTLSVPQMLSNEQVLKDAEERISQFAAQRIKDHTKSIIAEISGK